MLKLFRFADFWNRQPLENSADRIERALLDRTRRLVAGVHVDGNFENVSGSLVVARGRGKSLRVLYCDSTTQPIPDVIKANCLEMISAAVANQDFRNCIGELADVQATVIEQLKLKAGKYVDRILAISVTDPGLWQRDFDGTISYTSLCDATRLAERTGISVIDAWPDRDSLSEEKAIRSIRCVSGYFRQTETKESLDKSMFRSKWKPSREATFYLLRTASTPNRRRCDRLRVRDSI